MLRRQSTTNNIFHVEHVDKTSASFEGGRTIYEEMDRVQVTSSLLVERDMLSFV